MSQGPGGNVVPEVTRDEHSHDALAKRVLLKAFDGATYPILASESYGAGGAKDGLAVVCIDGNTGTYADWGGSGGGGLGVDVISTLMTAHFFTVNTTVAIGISGAATRKKVLFQADETNNATLYLMLASTTTHQLGIALGPGDVHADCRPYAYTGTYWFVAATPGGGGGTNQGLRIREWL